MASLAQYSAALCSAPAKERPAAGQAARCVGWLIYAGMAALVVLAASVS